MKITVNGTSKEFTASIALQELIGQFCKSSQHVIAEVNGEIVSSAEWKNKSIADGDQIELVSFVGGG